jgi:MFS family permease
MDRAERRAVAGLSLLYGLRLLGMYMVLPVLALHAAKLEGATPLLIGLSVGCYGLAQGVLQVPLGALGDRFGRRRILAFGLLLFAAGSLMAAMATDIWQLIAGRVLQGSGAIASTLIALIADLTRPQVRARAIGSIGAAVALSFGVGMVVGPFFAARFGVPSLFWLMAILPCLGAIYVVVAVPKPTDLSHSSESEFHKADLGQLLVSSAFIRLNFGIFALHMMTTALFVAGPRLLSLHVAPARHGLVYLALIPLGMVALRLASRRSDRSGRPREAILLAGMFVIVANLLLFTGPERLGFFLGAVMLAIMAVALAEPAMPTLLSRIAPPESRGTAGGLFHSFEFMGSFVGGALGGWFLERPSTLGAILMVIAVGWTLLAW